MNTVTFKNSVIKNVVDRNGFYTATINDYEDNKDRKPGLKQVVLTAVSQA